MVLKYIKCCEAFQEAFKDGFLQETLQGKCSVVKTIVHLHISDYEILRCEIQFCPFCGLEIRYENIEEK